MKVNWSGKSVKTPTAVVLYVSQSLYLFGKQGRKMYVSRDGLHFFMQLH